MLFGPQGAPLSQGESDDIDEGFRYLTEQVGQGKTAFYLGRSSTGYALLVASPKRFEIAGGYAVGVSLTAVALAALRNRVLELLHGKLAARRAGTE